MKIACVRAVSWFFSDDELLTFLREETLVYNLVARLTAVVKRSCAGLKELAALDENYAIGEFCRQLYGWTTQRRFVALRELVKEAIRRSADCCSKCRAISIVSS